MDPMRPPDPYLESHRLSDWSECTLELRCRCGRSVMPGIRMILDHYGDMPFAALFSRLQCKGCGKAFHIGWLVAGRHRDCFGGPESCDWAVIVLGKGQELDANFVTRRLRRARAGSPADQQLGRRRSSARMAGVSAISSAGRGS